MYVRAVIVMKRLLTNNGHVKSVYYSHVGEQSSTRATLPRYLPERKRINKLCNRIQDHWQYIRKRRILIRGELIKVYECRPLLFRNLPHPKREADDNGDNLNGLHNSTCYTYESTIIEYSIYSKDISQIEANDGKRHAVVYDKPKLGTFWIHCRKRVGW